MLDVFKSYELEMEKILLSCLSVDFNNNVINNTHLHVILGGYNAEYYRKEISEKARINNPNVNHLILRGYERARGYRVRYISFHINGMELKFDGYEFKA